MALNLLHQIGAGLHNILWALGPPEIAACLMVGVPTFVLVYKGLDEAEKVWTRVWATHS